MPSIIQTLPDYTGDLAHRKYLTGDWGGARTELANKGILFDLDVTQVLQGNAHGGRDTSNAFRYSGSVDYTLKLDTARMGLWPGGLFVFHGETKIGDNVNPKVGSLMAPNFQGLLPVPGDPGMTTLSEFFVTQALSEQFVLIAGKIDATQVIDQNAFASNQRTQFMNTGLRFNPTLFYGAPYTCLAAGAVWLPTKWLQVITAVADNDPDGAATMTGFNTAFHGRDWATVIQEFDLTIKPFDKNGHQRFGWFWTSRDFPELGGDGRIQFPQVVGRRLIARQFLPRWARILRLGSQVYSLSDFETSADTWGLFYNFDQMLFTEAEDPEQGVGIFGRFGYGGEPDLFRHFYSLGVSGKGSIPTRDRDTWGIGYYYADINDCINPVFGLNSEQGVETYYNIEITPWMHITPDLQIIVNPGGGFQNRDVAIVYGLRARINF
ncbi:MAG TPA: carbohydrate porin [Phycisphaerae bacterium]|nr:carbohydrate porin [Phycisphaerae bacterium]